MLTGVTRRGAETTWVDQPLLSLGMCHTIMAAHRAESR